VPPRLLAARPSRPRPEWVVIALAGGLALALGLWQLGRPHVLFGVDEYDDGVYFGAALYLVHGVLPYRDYAFVQPPGLPVLLAPLAGLAGLVGSRAALGAARVLTVLAGAADALLAGALLRHRGPAAAGVAAGLVALSPTMLASEHTLLLEPYLLAACLAGLLLAFDGDRLASPRRLVAAGAAFGVAGALKSWAILPFAALVAVAAVLDRRRLAALVLGAAVGFGVLCLPFVLAAPRGFIDDVVLAQLSRSPGVRVPTGYRLLWMTGLEALPGLKTPLRDAEHLADAAGLAVGLVLLARARALSALDATVVLSVALVVAGLLWPPEFYYHYAAFAVPFGALACGVASSFLAPGRGWQPRRTGRVAGGTPARTRQARCAAVLGALVLVGALALPRLVRFSRAWLRPPDLGPAVAAAIPRGACAESDQVSLLILANRFSAAGGRRCPPLLDATGESLALDDGRLPWQGSPSPRLLSLWTDVLRHADVLVLSSAHTLRLPASPRLAALLRRDFAPPVDVDGPVLLLRRVPARP
jgi:alpha-1,2-mannosyltransferase